MLRLVGGPVGGEGPARVFEQVVLEAASRVRPLVGCDVISAVVTSSPADILVSETARVAGARALIVVNTGVNRKHVGARLSGVSIVGGLSDHSRDVMAMDASSFGWPVCRATGNPAARQGAMVPLHGAAHASLIGQEPDVRDAPAVPISSEVLPCGVTSARKGELPVVTTDLGGEVRGAASGAVSGSSDVSGQAKTTLGPVVGYVGRVSPEKGLTVLLEAFQNVMGSREGEDEGQTAGRQEEREGLILGVLLAGCVNTWEGPLEDLDVTEWDLRQGAAGGSRVPVVAGEMGDISVKGRCIDLLQQWQG